MAVVEQQFRADTADVTGTTDNEHIHSRRKLRPSDAKSKWTGRRLFLAIQGENHAPHCMVLCPRCQHLETPLIGTPLQNIDVDATHTPLPHFKP